MSEICLQCGSHRYVPDACKCTTEGIQHTMDFTAQECYAKYDSFLKFDDQGSSSITSFPKTPSHNAMLVDPVFLNLSKEISYKNGISEFPHGKIFKPYTPLS
jgi:hypothetical protein